MNKKAPTMRDVARLAEVSVATVSAVANGTAVVSQKRAERVRKAMEALDYHADQIARSLKTGRTRVVGIILPDVTNPFFPEVIVGAEEIARAAGYSVILCNANEDPEQEQQQLNILFSHRVDGVLIACSDPAISFDRLMRRRFPIVCFDRIPPGFRGDTVTTDNFAGGYEATRHLIALGHKRIAVLVGRPGLSTHSRRLEGFRQAMSEARLPVPDERCLIGGMRPEMGYDTGRQLLKLPMPPTAIFCTNNKLFLGLVRAVNQAGIRCPEEVSLVGYDDLAWTENFHPRLTTVAQPTRDLGRRAMRLLLERIESNMRELPGEPREVILKPELRIRESTARAVVSLSRKRLRA
ncbi:MAG TPA: LacI family DNA-binding transcriptional regulator [Acidobacteriaceae bacterium]